MRIEHITNYTKNYTVIHNTVDDDSRLTWKDTGIFNYLWHLPKDWTFRKSEITKHKQDGINALETGIKDLKHFGYLKMIRLASGHVMWVLSDQHVLNKLTTKQISNLLKNHKKPSVEKPPMGFPSMAFKGDILSTKNNKVLSKQSKDVTKDESLREKIKKLEKQNEKLKNQNKNQSETQHNLNQINNGHATKIIKKKEQPKETTNQPIRYANFKRYDNSGHPLNERTLVASTIYSKFGITLSSRVCKGITLWLTSHTLGQVLKALNIAYIKHKQGKHIYSVSKYTSAILNKLPNRNSNQLKSTNTDTKVNYQIIKLTKYIDNACNKQGLGDSTYGNLRIIPTNCTQIHNFIIKNLKHHKINHIKSAFVSTCQNYGEYRGNDPLGDTQRQLDVELQDKQGTVTW